MIYNIRLFILKYIIIKLSDNYEEIYIYKAKEMLYSR